MPSIEVDQASGYVTLTSGEELTIPKAIEMIEHFKNLPKALKDTGLVFNDCTREQQEIFKAVIAVSNEMAEAQGEHDKIIALNEANATFRRDIALQVMQFHQGGALSSENDGNEPHQPLTDHPASVFDKPRRG